MTQFYVKVMNDKLVATKFERMGAAALDAKPAFARMAVLLFEIEEAVFESQGRRGGGAWADITAQWRERKVRNALDPRILHATHALRDSMTKPEAEGQILEITRNALVLGSSLPYAEAQNKKRPFNKLTPTDRVRMRNIIRDHLMAAWRGGTPAAV